MPVLPQPSEANKIVAGLLTLSLWNNSSEFQPGDKDELLKHILEDYIQFLSEVNRRTP